MAAVRAVALATRFLLELCALAAFAYWGYRTADGTVARLALAVAAPLAMVVVWGMLIAPRAPVQWPEPVRNVLGLAVFLAAAAGLHAAGRGTLAVVLAVIALADTAVLMWPRSGAAIQP